MLKFLEIVAMIFMFILAFVAFEWFIGIFFASEFISFTGAVICTVALLIAFMISCEERRFE